MMLGEGIDQGDLLANLNHTVSAEPRIDRLENPETKSCVGVSQSHPKDPINLVAMVLIEIAPEEDLSLKGLSGRAGLRVGDLRLGRVPKVRPTEGLDLRKALRAIARIVRLAIPMHRDLSALSMLRLRTANQGEPDH
jgi:hypothetical protein